jgi:hypothetical protein
MDPRQLYLPTAGLWHPGVGATYPAFVTLAVAIGLLTLGIGLLSVMLAALCVLMMRHFYAGSDIFDARAGFFAAVLLFLAMPAMVLDAQLTGPNFYWSLDVVRELVITRDDLRAAQAIVLAGAATVAAVMLLRVRPLSDAVRVPARVPTQRVWLLYYGAILLATALLMLQYSSVLEMLIHVISPVARRTAEARAFGTPLGVLLVVIAVSAFWAARRIRSRLLRMLLFLPPVLLAVPAGNRGVVLSMVLIAAAGVMSTLPRHPFRYALAACLLLPPFASLLYRLRYLALTNSLGDFTVLDLYADFAGESLMVPILARALAGLREGVVGYTYGVDLALFPLWFVPRVLWPGKPMPLDFRLNHQLGLNDGDVFGTPVSLFGGLWFNFTPWAYLPAVVGFALLVLFFHERWRNDRLLRVLLVVFIVDIVRVGDMSRELTTFTLSLFAAFVVRAIALRPAPATPVPTAAPAGPAGGAV